MERVAIQKPDFLPTRKTATVCTTAVTCWQCQLHPAVKLNKTPMVLKCLARNDKASKGTENTSQTQALHTTTTKLQVLPAHLQYRISLSHYLIVIIITIVIRPLICDDYLYDHFLCHSLIGWNNSDHSLPGFVKLLPCGQLAADQMKHHVHPAWSCGFDRLGPVANRLM